ncbi:hypothetical protein [Actinomycetospora lemnae]|uniref:Uncharacterized protein n=1 Tax=Actinomycetospora lemnae TaxID=3019891 RepID=A0ABT5SYA8_9PSEU|nr:hypothetical protein [Actinomycetospora sp. DW7H6]MDD7967126.1 hypothetical protein [Actinomycetospora sp. DW7H6]
MVVVGVGVAGVVVVGAGAVVGAGPVVVVVVGGVAGGVVVVLVVVPEHVTCFVTGALGALVQLPALAVTRTVMPVSVVVVVSVVDVPVTVFVGGTPMVSRRLDSTVYWPAPLTTFQLTGMVAVVTRPLVVHVTVPIATPVGVPIWPARADAVPVLVLRHAAVATPPPASSSVTTRAATIPRRLMRS